MARSANVARVWTTQPFVGHDLNATTSGHDLCADGRRENEASDSVKLELSSSSPAAGRRRSDLFFSVLGFVEGKKIKKCKSKII